jgi:hypothetical protein
MAGDIKEVWKETVVTPSKQYLELFWLGWSVTPNMGLPQLKMEQSTAEIEGKRVTTIPSCLGACDHWATRLFTVDQFRQINSRNSQ